MQKSYQQQLQNKTKRSTDCPLQPVVTRWRSWINAVLYYAKNLPEVKALVESFERSGISVTVSKVSLQATGLATEVLKVKDQYEYLD